MDHEYFMQLAIECGRAGVKRGQAPFGACIVKNEQVISCEHSIVLATNDVTAHAEINALRKACQKLKTIDLSGCTLYSTCEPCPMCFGACHWAKIDRIIYVMSIEDAYKYGLRELPVFCTDIKKHRGAHVELIDEKLYDSYTQLLEDWKARYFH